MIIKLISQIHQAGEGAYESRMWCRAKCKPRTRRAGNPEGTVILRNSLEILLTHTNANQGQQREKERRGQTTAQKQDLELEIGMIRD